MRILFPLVVLQILIAVFQIVGNSASKDGRFGTLIITSLLMIILSIINWLIYTPAVFRTFQKRAEGERVAIGDSIAFQRTRKWQYVVLSFWTFIYTLWYALLSIVPIVAGVYFGLGFAYLGGSVNLFVGTTLMFITVGFGVYAIYWNYPKIFFPLNVYFSKDKSPRDSVRESLYLVRRIEIRFGNT
jgi:hypothetical protein